MQASNRGIIKVLFISFLLIFSKGYAFQKDSLVINELDEVVLDGRLGQVISKQSKTVEVISAIDLQRSEYTNVVEALQQVGGLDIRRRGFGPTQADMNLRGGTFDQTLLLIDGIRLEDAQTGHHLSNFLLPIEVIERIEIIRGPAARIYGPNAFVGAINIVTKSSIQNKGMVALDYGSFGQNGARLTAGTSVDKASLIAHASFANSDGYRYNTDFKSRTVALKSVFDSNHPTEILGFFNDRKFGANGFYATPSATDQYEETQASLIAITHKLSGSNWSLNPRVYWRRGQDMYEYIRNRPEIYRNLHIAHKLGAAVDGSIDNALGGLGFGGEVASISIQSNNLGERNRRLANLFIEQRILIMNRRLDITPGVVVNYFSAVGTKLYPGLDLGWQVNSNLRGYLNYGKTFRVPTFTDLHYSDRTTLGNENLLPETSNAIEVGLRKVTSNKQWSIAYFKRNSSNLIDYVKQDEEALFVAQNIADLTTEGIDLNYRYRFGSSTAPMLSLSYTYMTQNFGEEVFAFSRYTIDNDLKHHFTAQLSGQLFESTLGSLNVKWIERATGRTYTVIDATLNQSLSNFNLQLGAFNVLNQSYWETSFIPMPSRNIGLNLSYSL